MGFKNLDPLENAVKSGVPVNRRYNIYRLQYEIAVCEEVLEQILKEKANAKKEWSN